MKFLSVATLLLASPLVSAASLPSLFDPTQATLKVDTTQDFPVKGDNPLNYCENPTGNILEIKSVDLDPNPPKPGATLTITASGVLSETIEEGATVALVVKWGLITLISQTVDLCEQIKEVDLECPLEKGPMTLTKDVKLPNAIPPGSYSVLADVYTKDQDKITCLKADDIQFHF
ncbi:unnamed protein product [Penicillium pancosmium]